jgi:hypothetical protein
MLNNSHLVRFALTIAVADGVVTLYRDQADYHDACDAGLLAAAEHRGRLCGVVLAPLTVPRHCWTKTIPARPASQSEWEG